MRNKPLQIRQSALGGFAIVSTFERRARVLANLRAVFAWVVIA